MPPPLPLLLSLAFALAACTPARVGALAISKPLRIPVIGSPAEMHCDVEIRTEDGLRLLGWLFPPEAKPIGLVIFVHGKDINRQHFIAAAGRFQKLGYAVVAYDQRAHGRSEGTATTYGFREVPDLRRAIDTVMGDLGQAPSCGSVDPQVPVYLVGESLGAAVVLQAAAVDRRVQGVVAGASFSDLRTIISEKSPFFLPEATRAEAIAQVEAENGFRIDDISPVKSAASITVPVLLLHGTHDAYIAMGHSLRILEALRVPKRLVRLEGVGHVDVLVHEAAWKEIEAFITALAPDSGSQ